MYRFKKSRAALRERIVERARPRGVYSVAGRRSVSKYLNPMGARDPRRSLFDFSLPNPSAREIRRVCRSIAKSAGRRESRGETRALAHRVYLHARNRVCTSPLLPPPPPESGYLIARVGSSSAKFIELRSDWIFQLLSCQTP